MTGQPKGASRERKSTLYENILVSLYEQRELLDKAIAAVEELAEMYRDYLEPSKPTFDGREQSEPLDTSSDTMT